jgi:hypothetical protein
MVMGIPSLAVELPPDIPTTSNPLDEPASMLSQGLLTVDPNTVPLWNPPLLQASNQLFIPLIDDPSYRVGDLELLGIDLKDLLEYSYAIPGTKNGV